MIFLNILHYCSTIENWLALRYSYKFDFFIFTLYPSYFETMEVELWDSTPRFVLLPEQRNDKISIHPAEVEHTSVYN